MALEKAASSKLKAVQILVSFSSVWKKLGSMVGNKNILLWYKHSSLITILTICIVVFKVLFMESIIKFLARHGSNEVTKHGSWHGMAQTRLLNTKQGLWMADLVSLFCLI